MNIRIVLLNYNGEGLLRECLPSVLEACRRSKQPARLAVIDNRSTDQSLTVLRKEFPSVDVYLASENRLLCSYNDYLQKIDEPVVILLNNDMRVAPDFLAPLVENFESEADLFMVTPRCLSFEGNRYEGGRSQARIKYGLFWSSCVYNGYESKIDQPGFTMAAGFGAFDRKKFLELGGYDDLYLPGRLEDNDLCFRAWRRGWKCLYKPGSVVYHKGAASFNAKFGSRQTLILGHRNSFLFLWKNISDPWYLAEHVLLVLPRLIHAVLVGKWELVAAFLKALPLLPHALLKRREVFREKPVRSDREIFSLVK